jgi:hypothetical protein
MPVIVSMVTPPGHVSLFGIVKMKVSQVQGNKISSFPVKKKYKQLNV